MKRKTIGYAVHYCDQGGLDVAYSFDPDVTGGVRCRGIKEPVAVFPDRASAARAIRISELAARLAKERGESANDDFLGKSRKHIRIVRVEMQAGGEVGEGHSAAPPFLSFFAARRALRLATGRQCTA